MADVTDQTPSGEEPSMEEILASIRKIIADDNVPEPEAVVSEDDVIDLTQMIQDDGSVVDITEATDIDLSEDMAPEPAPPVQAPVDPEPTESLVSQPVADAAASSIAALANTLEIERLASSPQRPTYFGNGTRTLEDMVLELMRPMLKEWLDKNLPATVDRLVQKEVERISRRAKD